MQSIKKRFALCFWVTICLINGQADADSGSQNTIGKPVALCEFKSLNNAAAIDPDRLKGKVVYIDFWASWCVPCAKSFSFLNGLVKEYGDRGLVVVGVSVDENVNDALTFLKRHPAKFETTIDSNGTCPKAFGVAGMPSSYLVDRQGILREVHLGYREDEATRRRQSVDSLLNENQ